MDNPKVSVVIITYNHEKYIAQAIDSVLMQETDFDFEIIIGEDDSSDNTRIIVKEYKRQHPDRIRLLLNDRKNVIYINGQPTGRWNFVNTLEHAQGEYVALLDGDDFWTSPVKLQRQVDFLDNNRNCALCFHAVNSHLQASNIDYRVFRPASCKKFYTLEELLKKNFIYTCSVMYRARFLGPFPEWFLKTSTGDWPTHILSAQHGEIGYLNEVMAMYRIHRDGEWSPKTILSKSRGHSYSSKLHDYIIFREHFKDSSYRELIAAYEHELYAKLVLFYIEQHDLLRAINPLLKCVSGHRYFNVSSLRTLLSRLRSAYLPSF